MAQRDDLNELIDELAEDDPAIHSRIADALARRELARALAARRRALKLSQQQVAARMGTSQGQIVRFEAGADSRLSTYTRYAAAVGHRVGWHLEPAPEADLVDA
ncbi:MAG TPA: helix-turn-helix transcriptional regulator [Acidimicrobiia bacterium]|nr:helix-turn-helix transcriptional regulator [Acidimicrobiia bacterium]